MSEQSGYSPFKSRLWLCWISIFVLPLGLLAIGGGPCAGQRNAFGSAILLGVGCGAAGAAVYGVARVLRSIRRGTVAARLWGIFSVVCAGFAALVGGVYLRLGFVSLQAYLRY